MRLFNAIRTLLLFMWPASLLAAPALQQSFDSVPGIAWLVASALSTLGGVTALMYRLQMQLEQPDPPEPIRVRRFWVLVASQMLCSWLAGAVFFLLGLHWQWPLFMLGAAVAVASFGGAKSIESVANWLITQKLPPRDPQ